MQKPVPAWHDDATIFCQEMKNGRRVWRGADTRSSTARSPAVPSARGNAAMPDAKLRKVTVADRRLL
jgi:hypothetical protein